MCHDSSRNSLFHQSQEIPDGDGQDTTERNTKDKADHVKDVVMSHSRSYKICICVVFFLNPIQAERVQPTKSQLILEHSTHCPSNMPYSRVSLCLALVH